LGPGKWVVRNAKQEMDRNGRTAASAGVVAMRWRRNLSKATKAKVAAEINCDGRGTDEARISEIRLRDADKEAA